MKEPEFDLNKVKGHVKLTKSVTIGPFQTVYVSGLTGCNQHFKRVNVIVQPDYDKNYEAAIPILRYTVLKPGSYEIVLQGSDGPSVYTVVRNDRVRTLHCNMLFPLGLWHDTESILDNTGESENSGNPVEERVDNFLIVDGEIDQPVYKGPQTWSCIKQLMKANVLMDQLFDISSREICDDK